MGFTASNLYQQISLRCRVLSFVYIGTSVMRADHCAAAWSRVCSLAKSTIGFDKAAQCGCHSGMWHPSLLADTQLAGEVQELYLESNILVLRSQQVRQDA